MHPKRTLAIGLALFFLAHGVSAQPKRDLKKITVNGAGYERGLQHGTQLKAEIGEIIAAWKANTEAVLGRDADLVLAEFFEYAEFTKAIKKWTPDLYDEIRGIADGSEQDFNQVFVLNLIDEFWVWIDNTTNHHCTGVGVPAADGRPTYIAQNMDLESFTDGFQVLLRIAGDGSAPEQLVLTYPGLIALNGINASGVGVCVNTLMQLTASSRGLPVAFVVRELIRRTDEEEILDFIQRVDHASGQNYIIGIRDEVYDFEASANTVVRFDPGNENGSVYHTNHPLVNDDVKPWYAPYSPSVSPDLRPGPGNSEHRFMSAESRMTSSETLDDKTIAGTLRSRDHPDHPVCRSNEGGSSGFTFASVIMTLSDPPSLQVVAGPPDEGEYSTHALAGESREPRKVDLSDLGKLVRLSDPRISPDGHHIVVIASRPNYDDNRFDNQLFLVDVPSGQDRPLTWDRHRVRNPRWSPDGSSIAFLALDAKKKAQIHLLPVAGGEARPITEQPEGVESFEWSPDGARLAFVGTEKPEEKEGPEKHNRSFEVGGDWYLANKVSPARHLWVIDLDGGEPDRVTTTHSLAYLVGGYSWTSDGRSLVYSGQPDPYSGSFLRSSIRRIDVDGAKETVLVEGPAPFADPTASPETDIVAFGLTRGEEHFFNPSAVRVVGLDGGRSRDATPEIDRSFRTFNWLPDGRSFLVSGADGTKVSLWHQPLDGSPRTIDTGDVMPGAISISRSGAVAFTASATDRASELYVLPSITDAPRLLTDFNADLSSRRLGRVETIRWHTDGFEADGVLVFPPDFEEGQRYPLVLTIHGGPMSASIATFDMRAQLFAANGWLVFSPNYRGSTNLGRAYQRAVINDAGAGPGRDVMAGIEVIKKMGIVDEHRIAVSGWSYGGYMTTWLTSHYRGWAAAVAGAAVTDWFDWYALSDMNVWSGYGLGGSPWIDGNDESYREQSPITYAHQIRTPMLILSTTLDPRVSVTQSFKLYSVLRDHDVPVKFVAYPVSGHYPADPVHRRDVLKRWMEWIEDHFDGE